MSNKESIKIILETGSAKLSPKVHYYSNLIKKITENVSPVAFVNTSLKGSTYIMLLRI